jgi:hypothetical protein
MFYDAATHRIGKEYMQMPGKREPHRVYLELEVFSSDDENATPKVPLRAATRFRAQKRRRKP